MTSSMFCAPMLIPSRCAIHGVVEPALDLLLKLPDVLLRIGNQAHQCLLRRSVGQSGDCLSHVIQIARPRGIGRRDDVGKCSREDLRRNVRRKVDVEPLANHAQYWYVKLISERSDLACQGLGLIPKFADRTRGSGLRDHLFRRVLVEATNQSVRVQQLHDRPVVLQRATRQQTVDAGHQVL